MNENMNDNEQWTRLVHQMVSIINGREWDFVYLCLEGGHILHEAWIIRVGELTDEQPALASKAAYIASIEHGHLIIETLATGNRIAIPVIELNLT